MKNKFLFAISCAFLFISCTNNRALVSNTIRYTIASKQVDCMGAFPQKCLLIKKGDAADWEYFYGSIEGFNYKDGYEYVLEIKEEPRKNVPADASSIRYVLVKELSKKAKESVNLPSPIK